MATRRIVKSGNTSFTLALPIEWVRRNNLETSKKVEIVETQQGDLLVSAEKSHIITKGSDIISIKVDDKDDQAIYLELFSAYTLNYSSIVFEGKQIPQKTRILIKTIRSFIGMDIIEQNIKSIVVKNFSILDKATAPSLLIRKVNMMNKASFELLNIYFTETFSDEDFLELQGINKQIDRLCTLGTKGMYTLIENPGLMKEHHTDFLQLTKNKVVLIMLDNVSAELVSLGKIFPYVVLSKAEKKRLQSIFSLVEKEYSHVVNAFSNRSKKSLLEFLKDFEQKGIHIEKTIKNQDDPLMVQALLSLEKIFQSLRTIAMETII